MKGAEYRAFLKVSKKKLLFEKKDVEEMTRGELLNAVYAYHHELLTIKNSTPVNPLAALVDTFFNGRPARMIFVSPEQGSAAFAPLLEKEGVEVDVVKLDWADVEFEGRGAKNTPVMIGVEIKQLSELTSDYDRFAGEQLHKLTNHYDHRWLLYWGEWTQNTKGHLLKRTGKQRWVRHHGQADAGALRKKLLTLEMLGGIHVQHVRSKGEVVKFLLHLYRWWTDDALDEHRSHIVTYTPHGLLQLTDTQKAIAAWPGIREKRAKAIARKFKSVRKAANTTVEELATIETVDDDGKMRKIGTKTAEQIVRFLNGER